jgi:hypothetical protein
MTFIESSYRERLASEIASILRLRNAFFAFFGSVGIAFILRNATNLEEFNYVVGAAFLGMVYYWYRVITSRCPYCGYRFFVGYTLLNRCQHCGIDKQADSRGTVKGLS